MPAIMCKISPREIVLLTKIADYMQAHRRSPKAHEVTARKSRFKTAAEKQEIKDFNRLATIGAIEHCQNGHCWLTPAGQRLVSL